MRYPTFLLLLSLCPGPVSAQAQLTDCPTIAQALDALSDDGQATVALPNPENCVTEQGLNGTVSLVCQWGFAFRAAEATLRFNALVGEAQSCLGKSAERAKDMSVNHPDSYDLRQFDVGNTLVSISLKDKSALEKTLVFLRLSR